MSAMIERVARVLCRFTWETQFGKQDLDACVDQEWPNHTDAARLSIAAMREPIGDQLKAGFIAWEDDRMADGEGSEPIAAAWRAMIDEALK